MVIQPTMPRVLTVAGSDPSAGAGVQADIKTISALGGYGMTVISAITAQNTLGVQKTQAVSSDLVEQQMRLVLEDIGADIIKTGMLFSVDNIIAVSKVVADYPHIPLVIDPIVHATSGDELLQKDALSTIISKLLPHATIITPNLPEAFLLSGVEPTNKDNILYAAKTIQKLGVDNVLIKGGHGEGDALFDLLLTSTGETNWLESQRINTCQTHGTGCTYASAIASLLAAGEPITDAVRKAHNYVRKAIIHAPKLGKGKGPLEHRV